MLRVLDPPDLPRPLARYAHGIEVPAGARLAVCSGQLGFDGQGRTPEDVEAQAELCFDAIAAILAQAGMSLADVVRLNAYVTSRECLAPYMKVRDRRLAGPPRASTLMIVSGFSRPEFKVELEAIAAKIDP